MAEPRVPDLLVLDREEAIAYRPTGREVCISIGEPRAFPPLSARFLAVLRVYCHDLDYRHLRHWEPWEHEERGAILFLEDEAREVLVFQERWRRDADRFVIHCAAGASRSPGVALGLADVWGIRLDSRGRFRGHNRMVRRTLRQVAREMGLL